MSTIPETLSGASQLAVRLAAQSGPGFSKDPGDYSPTRIRLSGSEWDPMAPDYNPGLDPLGFLVGGRIIGAEGVRVIIPGMLSGYEERDRVTRGDGTTGTVRFAIWSRQPDCTPVRGKGGGLKTARGGWFSGRFDEIFVIIDRRPCVVTLYDAHHVVADLSQQAQDLAGSMYEIAWRMTKVKVTNDGGYTHAEPLFTPLGVIGEPDGPTEVEIAQARRLFTQINNCGYPPPGAAGLRLVVNQTPPPSPPKPPSDDDDFGPPPPPEPGDPGPSNDDGDDIPDWIRGR